MYILKYYIKSKYNNYTREIEKIFDDYIMLINFIKNNNIHDYEVFINYKKTKGR